MPVCPTLLRPVVPELSMWALIEVMAVTLVAFGGIPVKFGAFTSGASDKSATSASAWSHFAHFEGSMMDGNTTLRDKKPTGVLPMIAHPSVGEPNPPFDGIWSGLYTRNALQYEKLSSMYSGASFSRERPHSVATTTSSGTSPVALQSGPQKRTSDLLSPRAGQHRYSLASISQSTKQGATPLPRKGLDISGESSGDVNSLKSLRIGKMQQKPSNPSGGNSNDFDPEKFLFSVMELVDGDKALSDAMKKAVTMADDEVRGYCRLRGLACTTLRELARDLPEIVEEWPSIKIINGFLGHVAQIEAAATHTTRTGLHFQTDSDSLPSHMQMHAGQLQEAEFPVQFVSAVISPVTSFLRALQEDLKGTLDSMDTGLAFDTTNSTNPLSPLFDVL